jgi:gliding motility-associated-like protein
MYVVDFDSNNVDKLRPSGGFYISPALPAGLSMDLTTGTISGTPTAVSAAKNYTVSTFNAGGGASATVNLSVILPNARLSGLTLSTGSVLTAIPGPGNVNYAASVDFDATSLTVRPTTADPLATVTVDSVAVTSGTQSQSLSLNATGTTTIKLVVTGRDGITQDIYYITINRTGSSNANLSVLTLNPHTTFGLVSTGNYAGTVPFSTASITLTPTTADAYASVTVNGAPATSGSPTGSITLNNSGPTAIVIIVTAQNGTTTRTYNVTVNKALSSNDNLKVLAISTRTTLNLVSSTLTDVEYTTSVDYNATSLAITPTTVDSNATVAVNGTPVTSGTATGAIALNTSPGVTTLVSVVVTAQDGVSKRTYNITVSRNGSSNATLKGLAVSTGTVIGPTTGPTGASYFTTSVDYDATSLLVKPTTFDAYSAVTVDGIPVTSGTWSGVINLNTSGTTLITLVVTAQDGVTTKTYYITVSRTGSSNASLSGLTLNPHAVLTATTGAANVNYAATVLAGTNVVTVRPTASDTNATIKVNGSVVASGAMSNPIAVTTGTNLINMMVTAQDGTTIKTYSILVTVPPVVHAVTGPAWTTASIPLQIEPVEDVVVHEAVSPNGDGINDVLTIDGITSHPDNKISIMNTDGTTVFEAKGYDNASKVFDGHDNHGNMQKAGTYFYLLTYKDGDQTKQKTGYIILKY